MNRSSSFLSHPPGFRPARSSVPATQGVADFLRAHDKMAILLPTVARMAALQKDCAALLPALFDSCSVMQFDAGKLVLATPNAALAAKLKQQLPKLQEGLLRRGWQVNAIRIKVQVGNISEKITPQKQLHLPAQALTALTALNDTLENSPQNAALKSALGALLRRHRASR